MRNIATSLTAFAPLCGGAYAADSTLSPPAADDATPDATVSLQGGSVAAGIGYTWGHGELNYANSSHKFSIHGISIIDVGATDYTAAGNVYHLQKLSDFAGNYVAADAAFAVAGGRSAVYLKNEHGVVLKLMATDVGLKFSLAADGLHVSLKN